MSPLDQSLEIHLGTRQRLVMHALMPSIVTESLTHPSAKHNPDS